MDAGNIFDGCPTLLALMALCGEADRARALNEILDVATRQRLETWERAVEISLAYGPRPKREDLAFDFRAHVKAERALLRKL